ncbi:MAG: hypothetical protein J3R72DRAFT_528604 [Linnemannia gamsii]|nr:MAG: hypothetical protein J3R72DRAFT_528604 [Linnemannia gamsii]
MTNDHLKLFCLVAGESTTNAFPLTIPSSETVGELRNLIKVEKSPEFDDIAADKLTLWSVLISEDEDDDERPILLDRTNEKMKLKATTKLSKVFNSDLPDNAIHIIVQRPPVAYPNARTSFNVKAEGNPSKTRAAPQDRGEPLASVGPPSSLGSASQALRNPCLHDYSQSSCSALFDSAESQDRSPQSTSQNNGSSSYNPTEAISNQGREGPFTGIAHIEGDGHSQNYNEALRCLLQAANQGHSSAQYKLGEMYENGDILDQDPSKAEEWYQKAGNQGNINAQRKLGFMYKHGHGVGVPKDYAKAQEWFKKAAEQGDVNSLAVLAFMKKNGQGSSKDFGRFLELGAKATFQGLVKGHRLW